MFGPILPYIDYANYLPLIAVTAPAIVVGLAIVVFLVSSSGGKKDTL